MTAPGLELTVGTNQNVPRIWPDVVTVRWPEGDAVDDARYEAFALGRDLQVHEPHVNLRPWKPAIELSPSELVGDMIELPTICGKHLAYYPRVSVDEARRGRFYAFVVSCDCGIACGQICGQRMTQADLRRTFRARYVMWHSGLVRLGETVTIGGSLLPDAESGLDRVQPRLSFVEAI